MISAAAARLRAAGSESPKLDATLLLAHALGISKTQAVMRGDEPLPERVQDEFDALIARREAHEPVAYIIGRRAFGEIELRVDPRVLIPRDDTETLVEQAIGYAPIGGKVHEVGTGSGAVALSIAYGRPDVTVTASDVSPGAVEVARENAAALGFDVAIEVADGLPPGDYDLVVANLPYVRDDEWDMLQPEIRLHEPRLALLGGPDGLGPIRALVEQAPSGQLVALEHGPDQGASVRALLRDARTERDLGGRERVTVGRVP